MVSNEPTKRVEPVVLKGARIMWRNFGGAKGRFNEEGDRFFTVFLDDVTGKGMLADGWNVKVLPPREDNPEDGEGQYHLRVKVNFGGRAPRLFMVTKRNKTQLDEDTAEMLDMADIESADLIIRPYNWGPIRGEYGITAYLTSIYANIREDELDEAYADIPDSRQGGRPSPRFEEPEEPRY